MKLFAERLKELRTEANLSIRDLSKIIGVTSMSISRWEREMQVPSFENAVAIAKLCGLEN